MAGESASGDEGSSIQGRGIHRWERNTASPTPHHRAALLQALQTIDTRAAAILKGAFSASRRTAGAAPMATQGSSTALAALPTAELGGPKPSPASRNGLSRDGAMLTATGGPSVAQTKVPNPALGGEMPPTIERDGASSAADAIELAVLRLADELDLPERRVRRPLVRLLRQLRGAKLTIEGAERAQEGWIGNARGEGLSGEGPLTRERMTTRGIPRRSKTRSPRASTLPMSNRSSLFRCALASPIELTHLAATNGVGILAGPKSERSSTAWLLRPKGHGTWRRTRAEAPLHPCGTDTDVGQGDV